MDGNFILRNQLPEDEEGNILLRRSRKSISLNIYKDFVKSSLYINLSSFDKRKDFGEKDLPGYFLLSLSLRKKISSQFNLSIRFENIFNKEYFTAASSTGYYRNQDRSIWVKASYKL